MPRTEINIRNYSSTCLQGVPINTGIKRRVENRLQFPIVDMSKSWQNKDSARVL